MAIANLINPADHAHGVAWQVDTYVDEETELEQPFSGPPGRDWHRFELTPDGARFEWLAVEEYFEDDDRVFADALESLDLPDWASVRRFTSGGMGSSFDTAALVLAPGKTLEDLARWLATLPAPAP